MSFNYSTTKSRRPMSEINVVPYIDVMLVLLVIFMVTAPLLSQGVKIDLPKASAQVLDTRDFEPLVVSVDRDGRYFLNYGEAKEKPLDKDKLLLRVQAVLKYQPGIPVLLRGDQTIAYGKVVEVMALLQSIGVPNIGLMTDSSGIPAGNEKENKSG